MLHKTSIVIKLEMWVRMGANMETKSEIKILYEFESQKFPMAKYSYPSLSVSHEGPSNETTMKKVIE